MCSKSECDTELGANPRDSMISRTWPRDRRTNSFRMRETEVATPVRPHTGLYHLKLAYLASPRGKDKPGVNTCSTPFNRLSPLSSSRFPLHQRLEHLRIIEARQPSSSYLGSLKMQRYDDGDGCVANLFERMLTRENGGVEGGIKRREREMGCIDVQGHVCRVALRNAST